jgi:hypothetical protein
MQENSYSRRIVTIGESLEQEDSYSRRIVTVVG